MCCLTESWPMAERRTPRLCRHKASGRAYVTDPDTRRAVYLGRWGTAQAAAAYARWLEQYAAREPAAARPPPGPGLTVGQLMARYPGIRPGLLQEGRRAHLPRRPGGEPGRPLRRPVGQRAGRLAAGPPRRGAAGPADQPGAGPVNHQQADVQAGGRLQVGRAQGVGARRRARPAAVGRRPAQGPVGRPGAPEGPAGARGPGRGHPAGAVPHAAGHGAAAAVRRHEGRARCAACAPARWTAPGCPGATARRPGRPNTTPRGSRPATRAAGRCSSAPGRAPCSALSWTRPRPRGASPDAPLFLTPRGLPYDNDTYRPAIRRACDRAGVERWSPNRLRHTQATEIRAKYGAESAQMFLGHERLSTTELYAEKASNKSREIAEELG
jgi:hypothetical protein